MTGHGLPEVPDGPVTIDQARAFVDMLNDARAAAAEALGVSAVEAGRKLLEGALAARDEIDSEYEERVAGLFDRIQLDPDPEPDPVPLAAKGSVLMVMGDPAQGKDLIAPGEDLSDQDLDRLFWVVAAGWGDSWMKTTRPHPSPGTARIVGHGDDLVKVTMSRAGHPPHSATTLWEQFNTIGPDRGGSPAVITEWEMMIPAVDFRTMKVNGDVAFNDGDWANWPGGHRNPGPVNWSVRTIINRDWSRSAPDSPLSAYLYHGTRTPTLSVKAGASTEWETISGAVDGRHGPVGVYRAEHGHTTEVVAVDGPRIRPGEPVRLRRETAVFSSGRVITRLLLNRGTDWEHVLTVSALLTSDQAEARSITRAYTSLMFGGTSEDFAPKNSEQSATVIYGAWTVHAADPDSIRDAAKP